MTNAASTRVIIVDSSEDDKSRAISERYSDQLSINYRSSAPGLTVQRNIALRILKESHPEIEVVHFIDDDVEIEDGYVESLDAALADPEYAGAGAVILGGNRRRPRLGAIVGGRDSRRPGVVLRTGFNIGAHETNYRTDVEWLPGCAMSFKIALIDGIWFDERREGYAIGEDVDFGLRAATRGKLVHVPAARLWHHQSPVNRSKRPTLVRQAVAHRWTLATDRLGRVRHAWVAYGAVSDALSYLVKWAVHRDRLWFDCARGSMGGLLDSIHRERS